MAPNDTEPRDNALPARRRSEFVRLATAQGQVTVAELAALFEVSPDTIRRDLDHLAARGLLTRTHGGAVPPDGLVLRDAPFVERVNTHRAAKASIGRVAAGLIADGETLLINGGSTTLAFGAALGGQRNLTVVTNNLSLPSALPRSVRDIYVLGGHYQVEPQVTIGAVGFAPSVSISVDTAVIGVGGISAAGGLSTTSLAEAAMITAMLAAAKRAIVLADASKFGHSSFAHIAPLDRMHVLVTDAPPPPDLTAALADAGVDVVLAEL